MKRFFSGVHAFLHYAFFILVLLVGAVFVALTFASAIEGKEGVEIYKFAIFGAIMMFAIGKLALFSKRKYLRCEKLPVMKPAYAAAYAVAFNFIVAIACVALFWVNREMLGLEAWTYENSVGLEEYYVYAGALFILMGMLMTWVISLNLPIIGVREYFRGFKRFARNYLSIFMAYQVGFALIGFICSAVVALVGRIRGGDISSYVIQGYFTFIADNDLGSFGSMVMSAIASLTTASSYFVLSDMAKDCWGNNVELPMAQRLRRMLFDSDTKYLLIMTIVCIAGSVLSGVASGMLSIVLVLVLGIGWLVSLVLFLKETKLLWYIMNFCIMTFIETALPTFETLPVSVAAVNVIVVAARILLFTFVALFIGYDFYCQSLREKAVEENPEQNNTYQKATKALYNTSILKAGLATANLVINRKEIARDAMEKLKDKAIDSITGKK